MRKLITTLLCALIITASFAQSTSTVVRSVLPDYDTLLTRTTVTTSVRYDTLKYVAPKPVQATTNKQIYYNGKTGVVIENQVVDIQNGGAIGILIQNCKNVVIRNCTVKNSTNDGIQLTGCTNVEIYNCLLTNVKAGVDAIKCVSVNVHDDQFLNMNGPFPSGNFVQFNNVSGPGCRINNNRCEDIAGVAKHPQDGLSVYQSNGLPGDSIQVIGNYIRGGQVQNDSGGGAAIVLGDVGGTYQVARYNLVVNGGFVGMQVQGGSHIKMDHNTIYGAATPYSNCGLCYGNYSGKTSTDITISYNKVKYFQTKGSEMDAWVDPKAGYTPIGWSTNILKANIDASILPATLITMLTK